MNYRNKGTAYEEIAASYLSKNGVKILKKNFRIRQGEVDLIGEDTSHLIFIEIKFRSSDKYGEPELAISVNKMKKICKVAEYYLMYNPTDKQIRYDVICICYDRIRWYKHAFYHIGNSTFQ